MKKRSVVILTLLISAGFASASQLAPEVRARALKVMDLLRKAEAGHFDPSSLSSRRLVFSEDDFNAFVAYDLEVSKEEFVREVVLMLQDNNRVEGKILIDLGGRKGSDSLPSKFELFFAANFESQSGRIRIGMDSLYLGTQRIPVVFIDTVIAVVSRLQGIEPTSLDDWYALPYGIQKLDTRQGRVIVHF